jgi:hypothetical protein
MATAISHEPLAGASRSLLVLRHALAQPLSSASLKLELVERKLRMSRETDAGALADRVRAISGDLSFAGHLLDLLLRLAEVSGQRPELTSPAELCLAVGARLDGDGSGSVLLRRKATTDAVHDLASFLAVGPDEGSPTLRRARPNDGWLTLVLEGSGKVPGIRPERLLDLSKEVEGAEALFLASAVVEADGGRLELSEREGHLVAELSWPDRSQP